MAAGYRPARNAASSQFAHAAMSQDATSKIHAAYQRSQATEERAGIMSLNLNMAAWLWCSYKLPDMNAFVALSDNQPTDNWKARRVLAMKPISL